MRTLTSDGWMASGRRDEEKERQAAGSRAGNAPDAQRQCASGRSRWKHYGMPLALSSPWHLRPLPADESRHRVARGTALWGAMSSGSLLLPLLTPRAAAAVDAGGSPSVAAYPQQPGLTVGWAFRFIPKGSLNYLTPVEANHTRHLCRTLSPMSGGLPSGQPAVQSVSTASGISPTL